MGLRSRQRRRAGVADPFDIETTRRSAHSLEDHLRASIRDVNAFNLVWKKTVAVGGLAVLAYEVYLLYLLLVSSAIATTTALAASRLSICLILKMVAFASIVSTREYISKGSTNAFGSSVFFTGSYFVIWFSCLLLLEEQFTTAQVSPLCIVYFVMSAMALRLIGDNTKAEVARAQQLEKLEQLFSDSNRSNQEGVRSRNVKLSSSPAPHTRSLSLSLSLQHGQPRQPAPRVESVECARSTGMLRVSFAFELIELSRRQDILCEQHHLQTEHHDGLPDWESHSEPAGIASEAHVDVPANFAWLRDNSKSSSSGDAANALHKKEAQVLQAQPTAPLPSHFHDEKRHFEHAGDENASPALAPSPKATSTSKRVCEDEELEAARKIEELRLETQKFMARLADINHSPLHSTGGDSVNQRDVHGFENSGDVANDSFQDQGPAFKDSVGLVTFEVPGKRHVDLPYRSCHFDPQQTSDHGSMGLQAPKMTFIVPTESSKRPARHSALAQPQASMFPIMESKKHRLKSSPEYKKQQHHQHANTRGGYRTTYSDANAWIHSDAPLTSAKFFKAPQVIDVVAGSGTNYERRYVLTVTDALRVAKQSAQEFLGENLQVPRVKSSGASPDGVVSCSAQPAAPFIQRAASPTNAGTAMRDEANQTELGEIHDAMHQRPPKVETSCQTDIKLLSPSALSLASGKTMRRTSASRKHAPPTPSSAPDASSQKAQSVRSNKTRSLHENPKRNGAKSLVYHQSASSSSNPVLMYPRYPPVPMVFRAKSTYATEFGKVDPSKKRIPAR